MMDGEAEVTAEEYKKIRSGKVREMLRKSWIIISLFFVAFAVPLLVYSYISTGNFWATYIRFWAIAGLIFGFLIGIPTGMVISLKMLFSQTKL